MASKRNALKRQTARLLDANLNRAREGLRVVEDAARYYLNSKSLYARLRSLRHKLHEITQDRYPDLIKSRNSRVDVGRIIPEKKRTSLRGVVSANVRRAQEATRVLEEFSKVFSPSAASELKAIRYKLYDLEKEFLAKL